MSCDADNACTRIAAAARVLPLAASISNTLTTPMADVAISTTKATSVEISNFA
jgi:hypothetical protein